MGIGKLVLITAAAFAVLAVGVLWYLIGPGPLDFAGKRVALSSYSAGDPTGVPASLSHEGEVKRGEYLARAADCVVCHTSKTNGEFAGGLGFTLPFGTLYSTNITPDKETGIGNYSDVQFLAALRRGVRADGAHLYPAMPFTSYGYISDADGLAIKAYLFSLAPVRSPARHNTLVFPFNQRWAIGSWSLLFAKDSRFEPVQNQSLEWNRGAYLAEALAHCGECHTPRNLAFALNNREKFGGAITGGWRAYNISGDTQTGVGAWQDAELLEYLTTGHVQGHGTATGPMGEAVDESFSHLTADDLKSLVTYLRTVPAVAEKGLSAQLAGAAPSSHKEGRDADLRGKVIFEGACVSCHGWSGESPLTQLATLTGSRAVNDPQATNVAQIVIHGTKRTAAGFAEMPSFGSAYSDAEIAAVATFVTGRFGTSAADLNARDVAKLRQQSAE